MQSSFASPLLEVHLFPAVDVYRLAGDEARAGTAEKTHRCCDFLRFAVSSERDATLGALARRPVSGARRVYASGRHAVHAYSVLGHLQRKRARHPRQPVLGGGAVHLADEPVERAVAAETDYTSVHVYCSFRETSLA